MTETPAEPQALVDALAYALARAQLPGQFDTSRDYAERLAPLVIESGYLAALQGAADAPVGGLRSPWRDDTERDIEHILMRYVNREFTQERGIECRDAIFAALAAATPEPPQDGLTALEIEELDELLAGANAVFRRRVLAALRATPEPPDLSAALDVEALTGALFFVYGNVTKRGAAIGPDRPGPREGFRPRSFWEEDARLIAAKYAEYVPLAQQPETGEPR